MNVETLTWTSESGCGESRTHCVRVRCGAVGVAYVVQGVYEVMMPVRCATDDGSGAHVLQIVIDELHPSIEGKLARSVIRPSRSLTRARTR